jgi:glutathione peroxidase
MKSSLLMLCFVIAFQLVRSQPIAYHLKEDSIIGSSKIDFSSYVGKKILLVNISLNSADTTQLRQLQQLYSICYRRLVIIAFPSNSFGTEPRTNSQIAQILQNNFKISFPVAKKDDVVGANIQKVYKWLTKKTDNTMMDCTIRGDYQKFLIDANGKLIGVFDRNISPLNEIILNEINK